MGDREHIGFDLKFRSDCSEAALRIKLNFNDAQAIQLVSYVSTQFETHMMEWRFGVEFKILLLLVSCSLDLETNEFELTVFFSATCFLLNFNV